MIQITYESLNPQPATASEQQRRGPQPATASVRRDSNGAVVTFLGTTRRTSMGKTVLYLEYEGYVPMAMKKLREIAESRLNGPTSGTIQDISILHRIGRLEIEDNGYQPGGGGSVAGGHIGRKPSRPAATWWTGSRRRCPSGRRKSSRMGKSGWGSPQRVDAVPRGDCRSRD